MYEYLVDKGDDGVPVLTEPLLASPYLQLTSESGPRHLVFHPAADDFWYLISELDSTVSTLSYDTATGQVSLLNTISTLPPPYDSVDMAAGEIQISRDGRFVYCSNRDVSESNLGRSSLSVFAVDNKQLVYLQTISSFGIHPRHFILHDTYVIIANRDSDNLVVMSREPESGLLEEPVSENIFTSPHLTNPVQVLIFDI